MIDIRLNGVKPFPQEQATVAAISNINGTNGRPDSDFETKNRADVMLAFAANYRATVNPNATLSEILDLDNCPTIC